MTDRHYRLGSLILVATLTAVMMSGCGVTLTEQATRIADRQCACQDAPCAESAAHDLAAFDREHSTTDAWRADQQTVEAQVRRAGVCLATIAPRATPPYIEILRLETPTRPMCEAAIDRVVELVIQASPDAAESIGKLGRPGPEREKVLTECLTEPASTIACAIAAQTFQDMERCGQEGGS